MLGTLLALLQIQKPSPSPTATGVWKYIDQVNDVLTNPDFDATIHNPWFIAGSIVLILLSLLRGWKGLLVTYVGGIILWGIVHHTVLKDQTAAAEGTQSIYVFAGLVVGVAGIGIYFLLIRD